MPYSTFYKDKKGKRIYTTKSLTNFHTHIREEFQGKTFEHESNAKLYFVIGMPLDEPLPYIREIK